MSERYSRQILFQPIGVSGQGKLAHSRVLLVGCGALGAAHAEMLARAGVGKLRIVDRDFVEFTNLQR
ncbi:MAG: ThiF family adenylyltransferase, partial [Pyrinomonadaceae bacterium]